MTHPVITDLFATIAASTGSAMGYTVNYMHGHMLEISNIVKQLSVDPDVSKRYPLLALQHDFKQKPEGLKGVQLDDLKIYIITLSRPEYTAQQRIETIFTPILHPLRDELVRQIARSGYFDQQTIEEVEEAMTWIDHLFWGRAQVMGNDGNIFNDWVDCVEISFSGLVALSSCTVSTWQPSVISAFTDSEGTGLYLLCNADMADPTGNEADITLRVDDPGSVGAVPDIEPTSIALADSSRVIHCVIPKSDIDGCNLTIDITSGHIADIRGNLLRAVTGLTVTNNVQP